MRERDFSNMEAIVGVQHDRCTRDFNLEVHLCPKASKEFLYLSPRGVPSRLPCSCIIGLLWAPLVYGPSHIEDLTRSC